MEEKTRCFIAIDLPRGIIKEVERIQEELIKKKTFDGKLTEGENLHLTLKFLGEISNSDIEKTKQILHNLKKGEKKFETSIGELGIFSPKFIRIIWLKILGKGVYDIQNKIDASLKHLFKEEERFMSHLTIVRVKKVYDPKIFIEKLKEIIPKKIKFEVDAFYLIKSELKPSGPEYTILEKFELE